MAPEILENTRHRKYTRAVDVWSLGVVLYICLCGFPPFSDELWSEEHPYNLSQQIKMGRFDYPSPYWDSVGDPALDLVDKMLTVDAEKRITIDECLEHPWITTKGYSSAPSVTDSTDGLTGAMGLLDFSKRKVARERTLLSDLNTVNVSKVIEPGAGGDLMAATAAAKVFEKNPDGKRIHNTQAQPTEKEEPIASSNGDSTVKATAQVEQQHQKVQGEAVPAASQQPQVFMEMGGRGDEQLFGNDRGSRYERHEVP